MTMDDCTGSKNRSFAYTIFALMTFLYLPSAQAEEPWTLIAVPDIQHYVDDPANVDDLMTQMRWIADNIANHRVAFVTQLGDIVQHGDQLVEWDRAETGIDVIHGLVPYSVSIGDHDYRLQEDRGSGGDEYVRRFGAARYQGQPWYGGASPDQKSHFQLFSAGGRQFLHLNLEWEAPGAANDPGSALGWAKQVLDAHPQTPTIVSTHSYVWDKAGEKGRTNGVEEERGDGSSGEMIWSELIRNSPQVFMVLNGNFHRNISQYDPSDPTADPAGPSFDGEYHQISTNLRGLPVYEMLSCYQDYPNGGDGWIRLIQFQPGAGQGGLDRISVQTYSTTHDAYQTDSVSQFHFDLRFAERFDNIPAALPLARTTVRTGEDTYVWKKQSKNNFGSNNQILLDTENGGGPQQGLVRFDIDFGGAIPAGAEIVSAQLRIGVTDSGNGFQLHRMLTPWSEAGTTWNSLGNGITDDGTQATTQPDQVTSQFLTESESDCHSIFDVTESVRAWQEGGANHGWALLPLGTDNLTIRSFESGSFRPELVIDYVLSGSRQVKMSAGEDAYIWKGQPQTNFGADSRIRVDLEDGTDTAGEIQPMQGLIRFDIPFGNVSGGVPAGAKIQSAQLRVRLTDSGHGFRLHRMLVPWSEGTATWDGFTNGIDDDGAEAADLPDVITSDFLDEPSTPSYLSLDVTDAVRAWQAGQANHGWAMLPLGGNKLIIESLQGSQLLPELVIQYSL